MMGIFLYLAEAQAEAEGGFGIKFDLLESNLINILILLGVLVYYGSRIVGKILSERSEKIAQEIAEAEAQEKQAEQALAAEQQKLAQAKEKAAQIIAEAKANAEKVKAAILAEGEKELERIKAMARQDLNSETERAIAELKQRAAQLALLRVEERLSSILDEEAQRRIIDRSIAQLGGN